METILHVLLQQLELEQSRAKAWGHGSSERDGRSGANSVRFLRSLLRILQCNMGRNILQEHGLGPVYSQHKLWDQRSEHDVARERGRGRDLDREHGERDDVCYEHHVRGHVPQDDRVRDREDASGHDGKVRRVLHVFCEWHPRPGQHHRRTGRRNRGSRGQKRNG